MFHRPGSQRGQDLRLHELVIMNAELSGRDAHAAWTANTWIR
jgi:hypothetical protein